jgi:glycerol-3-phosphate acyltransferase PlsY
VSHLIIFCGVGIFSYVLGSIPFGLLLVKLSTGKDIRQIESGRTGGTNAGRAAGTWAGVLTAFLDGLKAPAVVWVARAALPGNAWLHIFAPVLAILGHNHSIFLVERDGSGKIHLRGGAGGASCVGGSIGLWFPNLFIVVPTAILILYFGGYASVATLSIALISTLVFSIRAILGLSPWQYAMYGLFAEALLVWALRPNIKRLLEGNERLIGRRAQKKNDSL